TSFAALGRRSVMNRKSRTSRAAVAVLAALMAIVLIGCSGSGPSATGPSAVAPGSASVVVLSQTFEEVEAGGQRFINFSLPRRTDRPERERPNPRGSGQP